jgi:hypothetical protein
VEAFRSACLPDGGDELREFDEKGITPP